MCILLGHEAASARVLAGLERRGVAVAAARRQERLHTVSGRQAADALAREIEERVRGAIGDGLPMVRLLGHLGWSHPGWPAEREILTLEARLTESCRGDSNATRSPCGAARFARTSITSPQSPSCRR